MATDAVLKYLQAQNRPYSANDIVQNLHKEYGKTAVQKALDSLVEMKKIIEKIYGKQKVYSVVQEQNDSSIEQMNEDIRTLDVQCEQISGNLKEIDNTIRTSEIELKQLQNSLTTTEARKRCDELRNTIEKMKTKLKNLQETTVAISTEEKEQIIKNHANMVKEYRKRKRICMDIIDSIMEGYPKSKKQLIEEIGLETDEDVNFKLQ